MNLSSNSKPLSTPALPKPERIIAKPGTPVLLSADDVVVTTPTSWRSAFKSLFWGAVMLLLLWLLSITEHGTWLPEWLQTMAPWLAGLIRFGIQKVSEWRSGAHSLRAIDIKKVN